MELEPYLAPREFIDSGDSGVQEFAGKVTSAAGDDVSRAVKLYYAVRDGILYDPYYGGEARRYFRASDCLRAKRGFCIPKARSEERRVGKECRSWCSAERQT